MSGIIAAGGKATAANTSAIINIINEGVSFFFVLAILAFLIAFLISALEYRNFGFVFEEFNLILRKGILNRTETSIPYRQIQDVDITRSLGLQILGLSKLNIQTAGHVEKGEEGSAEIVLEPIERDMAEDIRIKLQREVGVQVVESEEKADKEAGVVASSDSPDIPPGNSDNQTTS